ALSEKYPSVYSAVGIHPLDVKDVSISDISEIEKLAKNKKVVGIGETGLDFYYGRDTEEKQKEFFVAHIEIAGKLGLPLIIHQRNSRDEVIDICERYKLPEKVVFHCFGGDMVLATYCKKKNFYISFTGTITFKNASDVRAVCKEYPLEMIMAETDAPFLAPSPFRGKRNDPSKVKYIVDMIASVKGMDIKCATKILNNSKIFFGI
ncbi:MAG: TatD family hydrolase, partial [Candidatus Omnitrophica bacterium]|nr:TatD family hydrolase [Candidatus Omnitrophota bacterium]